jgi:hypothetical protein
MQQLGVQQVMADQRAAAVSLRCHHASIQKDGVDMHN